MPGLDARVIAAVAIAAVAIAVGISGVGEPRPSAPGDGDARAVAAVEPRLERASVETPDEPPEPPEGDGHVAGRVVDGTGRGLAGLEVAAFRRGDGGLVRVRTAYVESDGEGRFRLDGLPDGPLVVGAGGAASPRAESATADATAGDDDVVLTVGVHAPGTVVRVRVVDPQGAAVPRACVRPLSAMPEVEAVDGVAQFDPEDLGRVFDVVDARGRDGSPLPLARTRVFRTDFSASEIVVALRPGRPISGRVTAPGGEGVEGVGVRAVRIPPAHEEDVPPDSVFARTDATGAFRLDQVGEGRFRVGIAPHPGFATPEPLEVGAGTTGVEVSLRRTSPFRVRIVESDGGPVAGATFDAVPLAAGLPVDGPPGSRARPSSGDGGWVEHALEPGLEHAVTIVPPHDRYDLGPVNVPRWRPRDETFTLPKVGLVVVRVVGAVGEPVSARVRARDAEGVGFQSATARFRHVGPEGLHVSARLDGWIHWEPERHVPPGKEARFVLAERDPEREAAVQVHGAGARLESRIVGAAGESARGRLEHEEDDASHVVFQGLRPDESYAVWLRDPERSLGAVLADLRLGDRARAVVLRPASPTRITLAGAPDVRRFVDVRVSWKGALVWRTFTWVAQDVIEAALPEGTYVVDAEAKWDGAVWRGSAKVEAGGSTTVTLERREGAVSSFLGEWE